MNRRDEIARIAYEAHPDLQEWRDIGKPHYNWDEVKALGNCDSAPFYAIADAILALSPQSGGVQTIPLPLWAAEDLLKWMRNINGHKPTLYPLGLENLLRALVDAKGGGNTEQQISDAKLNDDWGA